MKRLMIMVVLLAFASECFAVTATIQKRLPKREQEILLQVAKEYKLTHEQTKLLMTIRIVENGRPGLELGVGDGIPNHPARRYAGQFEKSLRLQGQWAAGTIRSRYCGNLMAFATRYCPVNKINWHRMAKKFMA